MLIGLRTAEVGPTMVTLITEKLQNQSLDDLSCKTYNINLRSSEKLNNEGSLFPYEINEDSRWKVIDRACPVRAELNKNTFFSFSMCPFSTGNPGRFNLQWQNESSNQALVSGWINKLNLNDSLGQPLAPPTKRHCRSLSEPDELSRCRSPWKPGNSKVWTPVSKRRCNSGGSATLQRCNSHCSATLQRSTSISLPQNAPSLNNNIFIVPTSNTSPVPRPSSASSGFVDSSEGSTNSSVRWNSGGSCDFNPRRRLSLSQEHITEPGDILPSANSTPTSTPELRRRQGLLRCRSQPCVLNERKTRLKRRRDEDVRWNRPSIDFFKMTRTSKSLCSLDYEDEEDPHLKTIVSSPCDSSDHMNIITPGSSPIKETTDGGTCPLNCPREATVSESEEDLSDCESTIFPIDCEELDLDEIENN
ncbi:protein FAM53A [Hyla sarda]|uniref:protein FAM53A n=1 Tax=Hyla sarda TaxID=327740 RepID=UPI0024C38684|nr:protein FAM53A [Hyla sarda]XP_056410812.1 protein FAM53A [Hyla sarda]XP_056410816.1 protein FAM53A [Hyla sarda]XP_056410832.1 protein FAM53A [Hyla sarda]